MLGIHWPEFMLIAVITVLVVGPKELPRVLRTITRMMRKIRGLSKEFQDTMNDLAKEADLDDMKKDFTDIGKQVGDMRVDGDLEKTLDGDNKIAAMFSGDVIGTELAKDARTEKAETSDDTEDDEDSEADPEAAAEKARVAKEAEEAKKAEEKERNAVRARKMINDAYDDLEQDLLNPSGSTQSKTEEKPEKEETGEEGPEKVTDEDVDTTPKKPVEKVAATKSL